MPAFESSTNLFLTQRRRVRWHNNSNEKAIDWIAVDDEIDTNETRAGEIHASLDCQPAKRAEANFCVQTNYKAVKSQKIN